MGSFRSLFGYALVKSQNQFGGSGGSRSSSVLYFFYLFRCVDKNDISSVIVVDKMTRWSFIYSYVYFCIARVSCALHVCITGACEFGEQGTELIFSITDDIVQSEWYLYPQKMKQMLLLVLLNAQKPVEFKIFGNVAANRLTFNQVIFF